MNTRHHSMLFANQILLHGGEESDAFILNKEIITFTKKVEVKIERS